MANWLWMLSRLGALLATSLLKAAVEDNSRKHVADDWYKQHVAVNQLNPFSTVSCSTVLKHE
ncbi:hypothetical protein G3479_16405 [Shewanella baltica]|uniref:hypothetical protein n=1 Tax=Shewanella baltica TaxID=62322 RepID=UPI00217E3398|nr:hypothetical protein [Shewanella baltica]MCS6260808.1 hypothetical protein [Shewanella baltica]